MRKIIYFDQNIWIKLAKGYLKKDISTKVQLLASLIEKRIQAGEIILPCYITHIAETFKVKNEKKRLELAGTMGYFSQNHFIKPYEYYEYAELQNLFSKKKII